MQKYLGIKIVAAECANATAEDKRGVHPIGTPGYKVQYEDGYTSWSPKEGMIATFPSFLSNRKDFYVYYP